VSRGARASWGIRALFAIGAVGLAARFVLAWLSVGCYDITLWQGHARAILDQGIRQTFKTRALYNHPPLAGYWAALSLALAKGSTYRFSIWLKLPGLLVEVLSAVLIYRIAARKDRLAGAKAFAAYGVSLTAILVAAYHGNTDAVYAGLTLLAAYAIEESAPFWAGAAMALAMNVKLLPIFLVPPFLACCRSWRAMARFLAGLSLAVIPALPFLLTIPRTMFKNMVSYNSVRDEWGLGAFFNYGAQSGKSAPLVAAIAKAYIPNGRFVILASVVVIAIAARLRPRWTAYELGALAWAMFLILTPGFGIQYSICIVPLLFASDVKTALVYSTLSGFFLAGIYVASLNWVLPLRADIHAPYAKVSVLFGVLAWAGLIKFVVVTFVRRLRPSRLGDPQRLADHRAAVQSEQQREGVQGQGAEVDAAAG